MAIARAAHSGLQTDGLGETGYVSVELELEHSKHAHHLRYTQSLDLEPSFRRLYHPYITNFRATPLVAKSPVGKYTAHAIGHGILSGGLISLAQASQQDLQAFRGAGARLRIYFTIRVATGGVCYAMQIWSHTRGRRPCIRRMVLSFVHYERPASDREVRSSDDTPFAAPL